MRRDPTVLNAAEAIGIATRSGALAMGYGEMWRFEGRTLRADPDPVRFRVVTRT
jgi:hypothetical protein